MPDTLRPPAPIWLLPPRLPQSGSAKMKNIILAIAEAANVCQLAREMACDPQAHRSIDNCLRLLERATDELLEMRKKENSNG